MELEVSKSKCLRCGRQSRQPRPGILRCQRSSEAFQKHIYQQHLDGIHRSRLGRREGIGAATVERYFRRGLQRQFREWHPPCCPSALGKELDPVGSKSRGFLSWMRRYSHNLKPEQKLRLAAYLGLLINNGGSPDPRSGKTFLGEYVLTDSEIILGLPQYEISNIERSGGTITISARHS